MKKSISLLMNENKKNNLPTIVIIVLVIALAVCYAKIRILEKDIERFDHALHNQHQEFMNQVESIYSNVDQMLREEASLLSGVTAEYGELNTENHTIDVTVKMVPKLISDDMKLQVSINGRNAELKRDGSSFTGTIPVDIYNMGELMLVTIETPNGIQTQYLPEIRVEYLWAERIPTLLHCDISGNGTFTEGKYTLNGSIDINCNPVKETSNVKFESFVLITELNGLEINREDITNDVLNYEAYPNGVYWRDEYKMECEAKEGDALAIYVEATDSLGYVHRMLLHFWKEQNGAMAEAVDASEYIYDPNGVQIFP